MFKSLSCRMAAMLLGLGVFSLGQAVFLQAEEGGENPFKIGEPFPNVVLPLVENGRPASVADFRGRKLLLLIFASG